MDSAPPATMTLRCAGADAVIGERDGLETGGAKAVDGCAGNLNWKAGAESSHACDVPTLLALGLRAAEDDVVNGGFFEGGDTGKCAGDCRCGEIVGACGRKRAFGSAAHGRANGGDEDGSRHGVLLLHDSMAWSAWCRDSVLRLQHNPSALQIEVVDGVAIDERIGEGVVVEERRARVHAGLRLVDLLR